MVKIEADSLALGYRRRDSGFREAVPMQPNFAAAVGPVPRQYSTGGRSTLLGISKRGDKNIRHLLVRCARAFMLRLDKKGRFRRRLDTGDASAAAFLRGCLCIGQQAWRNCMAIMRHNTVFEQQGTVTVA